MVTLDFSERQTGKSTRLIKACVDYVFASEHNMANVVASSHARVRWLVDKTINYIMKLGYDKNQAALVIRSKIRFGLLILLPAKNFVDDCETIKRERLDNLDPNGYYTASTNDGNGINNVVSELLIMLRRQRIDSILT